MNTRKLTILVLSVMTIVLVLSSCCLFPTGPKATLKIYVVEANGGAPVANSQVVVKSGTVQLTTSTTDSNGIATVEVPSDKMIDIYLTKSGYALSSVLGLKVYENKTNTIEMIQMKATLDPNPSTQTLFTVNATLTTLGGGTTIEPDSTVTGDFNYSISVNSVNDIQYIYVALGKIPGASYMTGDRNFHPYMKEADGTVSIEGFDGYTPLHIVVYDYNDNRVDKIIYLDVDETIDISASVYIPEDVAAIAYTVNRETGFFSPGPINASIEKHLPKTGFTKYEPEAAPTDSNLWIDVEWTDWANRAAGSDSDQPLGYNVYRSFDGSNFVKIQFVQGSSQTYLRDKSAELAVGKEVWYKVTSAYSGGVESVAAAAVHTTPLARWNVTLDTPADRSVNVSRRPNFSLTPANTVTGDSTITYEYLVMLSDDVNGANESFCPVTSSGYLYEIFDTTGGTVSLDYTEPYGWYNIYESYLYPANQLEPNKTYQWDVILAIAYNDDQTAVSIASDWWPFVYAIGDNPYVSNRFTTGAQ